MNNWQPIETAPKDGTYVIIYVEWPDVENQIVVANWVDHGFTWSWRPVDALTVNYLNVHYWMPLPKPPKGE